VGNFVRRRRRHRRRHHRRHRRRRHHRHAVIVICDCCYKYVLEIRFKRIQINLFVIDRYCRH